MAWFEETSSEDRLIRCENKATETRELLLGALLLAKGVWKDELPKDSRPGESQRRPAKP